VGRPRSSAPGGGGRWWQWRSGDRERRGRGRGASVRCGELAVGSIGAEEGRGGVLHGEQGAAAAAMACGGQELDLAQGEAEQVRGEVRQPGTQRIAAGRRRISGD
jgi:hypothetical protein